MNTSVHETAVHEIVAAKKDMPGALLPILHEIQHTIGYIPADCVPVIAVGLNLSRAEVHGVISFYPHFYSKPMGKHVVQICRAEACQAVGARALEAHVQLSLDVQTGESTADGNVTVEPVYCLGNCACGPSVRVGDDVYARVTPERFDELLAELGGS
ncbi:MAG: formate dehydrogenase subunit gamma [Gammaproteobacteria bacterium]|nr:MAG: formate dehydrogenase subunit gamma [Gammaproteobacteria bacterium]RLA52143.1 MAG: formate dehydrogenase subunit gamma [Gammaproteobacteria bacterium]